MLKSWMVLPVIILACLILSCNIINPAEDIPAHIKVDTLIVKVTNYNQGSAKHHMTCVKLNVAGTTLGIFEMPAMVPCLFTGLQSLYLEPVFELNGITGSREVYPFFKPYTGSAKIDFVPGQVITIVPETTYKSECKFPWIEGFENAGVSFLYPAYSDTVFRNQTDTIREGRYSGAVYLNKANRFFESYSSTDYELSNTGTMVLLEFDYFSTALLEIGVYAIVNETATWNSLVYVRPINHWNRIYIDLRSIAKNNPTADLFRPGFRAAWDSTGLTQQAIIMDNLKLIHF